MKDEETLTPQGRLQLAQTSDTPAQRKICPYILKYHKIKLKVKAKVDIQKPEILDHEQGKNAAGLNYFGVITTLF